MFVEQRAYQLLPGVGPEYLELYERKGMQAQLRYLPLMMGYYLSEIGDLNEIVHMWLHESLDAREANRARMRADPDFNAFWTEASKLIVRQRTRILKPAPFFEPRLGQFRDVILESEA